MKKYLSPVFWGLCFIIFTILVKVVDVQPLGAQASLIGFANLNKAVFNLLGTNIFCYNLTQAFGLLAILVAGLFAVMGCLQLIKRKSLFKVDRQIITVGIVYLIVVILYVLFEKLAINYRPVLFDQELQASYPSTHTMLILTIFGTAIPLAEKYIKSQKLAVAVKIFCIVIMWLTLICRLLSGVHWFTDIIGGLLISLCLISLFKSLVRR